jgi:hypothetical protein
MKSYVDGVHSDPKSHMWNSSSHVWPEAEVIYWGQSASRAMHKKRKQYA